MIQNAVQILIRVLFVCGGKGYDSRTVMTTSKGFGLVPRICELWQRQHREQGRKRTVVMKHTNVHAKSRRMLQRHDRYVYFFRSIVQFH